MVSLDKGKSVEPDFDISIQLVPIPTLQSTLSTLPYLSKAFKSLLIKRQLLPAVLVPLSLMTYTSFIIHICPTYYVFLDTIRSVSSDMYFRSSQPTP